MMEAKSRLLSRIHGVLRCESFSSCRCERRFFYCYLYSGRLISTNIARVRIWLFLWSWTELTRPDFETYYFGVRARALIGFVGMFSEFSHLLYSRANFFKSTSQISSHPELSVDFWITEVFRSNNVSFTGSLIRPITIWYKLIALVISTWSSCISSPGFTAGWSKSSLPRSHLYMTGPIKALLKDFSSFCFGVSSKSQV